MSIFSTGQYAKTQLHLVYEIKEGTAKKLSNSKGDLKTRMHLTCFEKNTTYDIAVRTLSQNDQIKIRGKGIGFFQSFCWTPLEVGNQLILINTRSATKRLGFKSKEDLKNAINRNSLFFDQAKNEVAKIVGDQLAPQYLRAIGKDELTIEFLNLLGKKFFIDGNLDYTNTINAYSFFKESLNSYFFDKESVKKFISDFLKAEKNLSFGELDELYCFHKESDLPGKDRLEEFLLAASKGLTLSEIKKLAGLAQNCSEFKNAALIYANAKKVFTIEKIIDALRSKKFERPERLNNILLNAASIRNSNAVLKANGLKKQQVENISKYVSEHYIEWLMNPNISRKNPLVVERKTSGLARHLKVIRNNDGGIQVFVLFNRLKQHDSLLGEGSWKKAKIAVDVHSGRPYTRLSMAANTDALLKGAKGEFNQLMQANHIPGLVQTVPNSMVQYISKEGKRKVSFLQELYNAGNLGNILDKKALTENQKCEIAKTIVESVANLNKKGIIHRDVKLENVFVHEKPFKAALGDLGLCRAKYSTHFGGTPPYLSPEYSLARFQDNAGEIAKATTEAHDAWAVGITLLQLYRDRRPWSLKKDTDLLPWFFEDNLVKLLAQIAALKDDWLPEPTNENSMEHIIWEMLRVNPKQRLTAEQALQKMNAL